MHFCLKFKGPFALTSEKLNKMNGLDPHVLLDALAAVMGNEERELCVQGLKALSIILKVSTLVLESREKVFQHGHFLTFIELIKPWMFLTIEIIILFNILLFNTKVSWAYVYLNQ